MTTIKVDIAPSRGIVAGFPAETRGWTLQGDWNPNDAEREASWDLLVELVTRISVVPLAEHEGLLREALSSLYTLFATCRTTLRRHGAALAEERAGELSFAVISAHLLNNVLRPVLGIWHPKLLSYEVRRGATAAPSQEVEKEWEHHDDLRALLHGMQELMVQYARVFAAACGAREFLRFLLESVDPLRP